MIPLVGCVRYVAMLAELGHTLHTRKSQRTYDGVMSSNRHPPVAYNAYRVDTGKTSNLCMYSSNIAHVGIYLPYKTYQQCRTGLEVIVDGFMGNVNFVWRHNVGQVEEFLLTFRSRCYFTGHAKKGEASPSLTQQQHGHDKSTIWHIPSTYSLRLQQKSRNITSIGQYYSTNCVPGVFSRE